MKNETDQKQEPDVEQIVAELLKAKSVDELLSPEGILKQVLGQTLEKILEGEMAEHLGDERYEAKGRNSGNSRNGSYGKRLQTSSGEVAIQVPRDRSGEFEPQVVQKYETSSNELEDKVLVMYAKGMTTRDIEAMLYELYGAQVSSSLVSSITDKGWPLVEEWQNRPLEAVYPVVFLDAIHVKIRLDHQVQTVAVYVVLGISLEGQRDVLGHWVSQGEEGAAFWLGVLNDLQARGVSNIFIACMDGLAGFSEAIETVFPRSWVQRCIIHQIRASLKYVGHRDRKAFVRDLKAVYKTATREAAEAALTLILNAGAGDLSLDLSNTLLQSLEINAGAGEISVILPASGDIRIDLNMGAGSIAFTIPETLEASLNVEGLVVNVSVPDDFNETGFHSYQTAGYGSGAEKATIFINGAAGEVRVTR